MSITPATRARQAIHAATGVPRLYLAAIHAGTGPVAAARVIAISAGSLVVAAEHGPGEPGRQNALRHFLWQALLTARHGREVAVRVAAAQERATPARRDSEVDHANNAVGQAYGAAHAETLARGSVADALASLVAVGLAKWDAGELRRARTG